MASSCVMPNDLHMPVPGGTTAAIAVGVKPFGSKVHQGLLVGVRNCLQHLSQHIPGRKYWLCQLKGFCQVQDAAR